MVRFRMWSEFAKTQPNHEKVIEGNTSFYWVKKIKEELPVKKSHPTLPVKNSKENTEVLIVLFE